MITTAVIMAAGLGSRFGIYTEDRPKAFIEVGGKTMIERSIDTLKSCGIKHVIIGTGYRKEAFEELADRYNKEGNVKVTCCFSPKYAETNSMYTLYNMRHLINEDILLLESDLIYEKKAIISLIHDSNENIMLTTPICKFQDQYYVEFDDNYYLINCSTDKTKVMTQSELVGIHRISLDFFNAMASDYEKDIDAKLKLGYEYAILSIAQTKKKMHVLNAEDLLWYEIDDVEDKKYAEINILPKILS